MKKLPELPEPIDDDLEELDAGELAFLSWEDLQAMPPTEPLIGDWLDKHGTVMLVGETGTNKSFLMLDWMLTLASDEDTWLEHQVHEHMPSLLLVGEGLGGLPQRVIAWQKSHDISDKKMKKIWKENIHVARPPRGLTLLDEELWEELAVQAEKYDCGLVGLDTMSSLAPTMRETEDAPLVVRYLADLAEQIRGTAVMAHHTGWQDKTRTRGSSALEANVDTVLVAQKVGDENNLVKLWRKKNKDGENGKAMGLKRMMVGSSVVLAAADLEDGRSDSLRAWSAVRKWMEETGQPCNITEFFQALGVERTGEVGQRLGKAREAAVKLGWLTRADAPEGRKGIFTGIGQVNPHIMKGMD